MYIMKYFTFGIYFLIYHFNYNAEVKAEMEMIYDVHQCNATSSIVTQTNCHLSKNKKRRTFNLEITFSSDVKKFFFDLVIVFPRKPRNFVLINMSRADGCQMLGNENQIALVQLGRAHMDKYSNFPKKCPFQKDVIYYVRGYRYDIKFIPAFSFESDMLVWVNFYSDRTKVWEMFLKTHIQKKGRRN